MTDRVRTLTVLLKEDSRVDDVEQVVSAIRMLAPVEDVKLGPVVGYADWIARRTALSALGNALREMILGDEPKGGA